MRPEPALILSGTLSVVPGLAIAALDDGRAQYGLALLVVALPFHVLAVGLLVGVSAFILGRAGRIRLRPFFRVGVAAAAAIAALVVAVGGGWLAGASFAAAVLSAFLLYPALIHLGAKNSG